MYINISEKFINYKINNYCSDNRGLTDPRLDLSQIQLGLSSLSKRGYNGREKTREFASEYKDKKR